MAGHCGRRIGPFSADGQIRRDPSGCGVPSAEGVRSGYISIVIIGCHRVSVRVLAVHCVRLIVGVGLSVGRKGLYIGSFRHISGPVVGEIPLGHIQCLRCPGIGYLYIGFSHLAAVRVFPGSQGIGRCPVSELVVGVDHRALLAAVHFIRLVLHQARNFFWYGWGYHLSCCII